MASAGGGWTGLQLGAASAMLAQNSAALGKPESLEVSGRRDEDGTMRCTILWTIAAQGDAEHA